MVQIKSIQFKRGNKDALIAKLVGENKPKKGEPIWELDSNLMKLGDGVHDYVDLPYLGQTDGLVLDGYYDAATDTFFKEATHQTHLIRMRSKIYRDLTEEEGEPNNLLYHLNENNDYELLIQMANAKRAGLVKLYDSHGNKTDGTMTQKAITEAIDDIKFGLKDGEEEVMILEKPW